MVLRFQIQDLGLECVPRGRYGTVLILQCVLYNERPEFRTGHTCYHDGLIESVDVGIQRFQRVRHDVDVRLDEVVHRDAQPKARIVGRRE